MQYLLGRQYTDCYKKQISIYKDDIKTRLLDCEFRLMLHRLGMTEKQYKANKRKETDDFFKMIMSTPTGELL